MLTLLTGSVFVFVSHDGGVLWSQTQKLLASNGASNDQFGISVALQDNVLVVGASSADLTDGNFFLA